MGESGVAKRYATMPVWDWAGSRSARTRANQNATGLWSPPRPTPPTPKFLTSLSTRATVYLLLPSHRQSFRFHPGLQSLSFPGYAWDCSQCAGRRGRSQPAHAPTISSSSNQRNGIFMCGILCFLSFSSVLLSFLAVLFNSLSFFRLVFHVLETPVVLYSHLRPSHSFFATLDILSRRLILP